MKWIKNLWKQVVKRKTPSIATLPMVEAIRCAIDYQAVGRKLLFVEELPQGAYARYEKDFNSPILQYRDKWKNFRLINIKTIKK